MNKMHTDLPKTINEPFIVINGDILTKFNINQLIEFHNKNNSIATICVREHEIKIPYGVIDSDGIEFKRILEKPTYRKYVNAGVDGIMIHSRMNDPDEIFSFIKRYNKLRIRKPLVCVPSSYNQVFESELSDSGVNIIIYANHLLRSSYFSMAETAKNILKYNRAKESEKNMISIKKVIELIE